MVDPVTPGTKGTDYRDSMSYGEYHYSYLGIQSGLGPPRMVSAY